MTVYMAELDEQNIVARVIVAPNASWPAQHLGGSWIETADPAVGAPTPRYCGPGYRWEPTVAQFFPWRIDLATGSLWCLASAWGTVLPETQDSFIELTGLTRTDELLDGTAYVVFGGRTITDDDVIALGEALA